MKPDKATVYELFQLDFQSIDGWDAEAILQRGRSLFRVASRIWPATAP